MLELEAPPGELRPVRSTLGVPGCVETEGAPEAGMLGG
jgi:hypothetical protein